MMLLVLLAYKLSGLPGFGPFRLEKLCSLTVGVSFIFSFYEKDFFRAGRYFPDADSSVCWEGPSFGVA